MKREDCNTTEERMMFDILEGINSILQELKIMNSGKIKEEIKQSPPTAQSGVSKNKPKKKRAPSKKTKKEGAK
jgi:hypothetical protein